MNKITEEFIKYLKVKDEIVVILETNRINIDDIIVCYSIKLKKCFIEIYSTDNHCTIRNLTRNMLTGITVQIKQKTKN